MFLREKINIGRLSLTHFRRQGYNMVAQHGFKEAI